MSKDVIPRKTVYRLSLYQRCLERLQENHIETVSSEALSKAAGVKSAQLRKDLAYFGQFGTRGLGYGVAALNKKLTDVLGTTRLQPVILVGVGSLGIALLKYQGFAKEGFEVLAAFDNDPRKAHENLGIPVLGMESLAGYCEEHKIKMAILCVPGTVAQAVTNELVEAGIQAILNFAPVFLQVPGHVVVNSVDLAIELENLSYFIR